MLRGILFDWLFYLSGGTFLSFGFLKQNQVGRRYFLYHGLGASALTLLAFLLLHREMGSLGTFWLGAFIACSAAFSVMVGRDTRVSTGAFFLGVIAFFGALVLGVTEGLPGIEQDGLITNAVLSALTLGFSMAAMLLGHWYLVEPKLSINELARTCYVLYGVLVARLVYSLYGFWEILRGRGEVEMMRYLVGNPGVYALMRFVWGIILPIVLSFFVYHTVKIRSTQSATGILYVLVTAIFVGEILSLYLATVHGIAF